MKNMILSIFWISALFFGASAFAQTGVGFGTTNPQALIHIENGHLKSTQTTPLGVSNITGGTFPATIPIATVSTAVTPPTDVRGTIAIPGSTTAGTSTATITFSQPYNSRPTVVATLAGDTAASLGTTNFIYTLANKNGFSINLYTLAATNGTTFYIDYIVIE